MTKGSRVEQGSTLIELMMAIVIVSIAGVALLGGMATGIASSSMHRQQTDVGTVLASAVEAVKDQGRNPFQHCRPNYQPTAGVVFPSKWSGTVKITSYQWWDGTRFQGTCPPGNLFTLQLIAITVSEGNVSQARSVVKGAP